MNPEDSAHGPNAIYANRALCHAYRAAAVGTAFTALSYLAPEEILLPITLRAWLLFEVSQILRYGVKACLVGRQAGRALRLSLYEGAFLSILRGVSK